MADRMLTVQQVAARLNVSDGTVRALIRRGKLPAVDVGAGSRSTWRIPESALRVGPGRRQASEDRQLP